jgi:hypothetical protein
MNATYVNSIAERFIRFRSGFAASVPARADLFNGHVIYMPSFLATANIIDYDGTSLTDDVPIVKVVTVDNYESVMQGSLLAQYAPIFNDGANVDVILYIVVFNAADATAVQAGLVVTASSIKFPALENAFKETYFIGFYKTMFSETYDGVNTDAAYFDLALCLAYLCQYETTLSYALLFTRVTLPLKATDTNICKIASVDKEVQVAACTALNVTIADIPKPRDAYFWGMLNFMTCDNTMLIVHSEPYNIIPLMLAKYFDVGKNGSGSYVGNKLSNIRLSGSRIKAMGTPSILNASVNANMPLDMAQRLDEMNVAYLVTISDASANDCALVRSTGIQGFPVNAYTIGKFVDYNSSQDAADWITAFETGTNPVLRNEQAYNTLQTIPIGYLQKFVTSPARLEQIRVVFPAFNELPKEKTAFTVTKTWEAKYVDDLASILVTGTIVY